jgi:hypothetical protein
MARLGVLVATRLEPGLCRLDTPGTYFKPGLQLLHSTPPVAQYMCRLQT